MKKEFIILMSTYNGDRYLSEQIESIKNQTETNWKLYVWDDGSKDRTLDILRLYEKNGIVNIVSNRRVGYPNGFYNLLDIDRDGDYYAFCDQDDVWLPDKLEIAKKMLKDKEKPSLYCSKKYIVDKDLKVFEDDRGIDFGFFNAMLKSNKASGCTMVMNKNLYNILIQYKPRSGFAPYHDSWCYKIAVIFGDIVYDETPHILYRQHSSNTVGAYQTGWKLFLKRVKNFDITFKRYRRNYGTTNYAKEIITGYGDQLPYEYVHNLNDISNMRTSFAARMRIFRQSIAKNPVYEYISIKIFILLGWM